MSKKNKTKRLGKCGYRLHDERIDFSGGTDSIRTIKYELTDPNGLPGLKEKIARFVEDDNRWLYGNVNLNDYINWRKDKKFEELNSGVREESFLGLWVEAISLGFVFSKQSHAINDFSEGRLETVFDKIPNNLKVKINKEKWCEWAKAQTPKTNDQDKLKGQVYSLLLSYKADNFEEDKKLFQKIAEKFSKNKKDKFTIWGKEVKKLPEDNFPQFCGLDEDGRISSVKKNVNWHCDPNFKEITEKDWTKRLDIIINFYNDKFNIRESSKDDKTSNTIALYQLNQGLMFGFLGNFFIFIKNGQFDNYLTGVKKFFNYSDSQIEVIRARLRKLNLYVKKIPTKPSVVDSWASYSGDFGGTLESWYSNRIEKIKNASEQLISLKETLEKIKDILEQQSELPKDLRGVDIKGLIEFMDPCVAKKERSAKSVFSWARQEQLRDEKGKIIKGSKIPVLYFVEKNVTHEFSEKLEEWLASLSSELNEYNQKNKIVTKNGDEVGILDSFFGFKKGEGERSVWQEVLSKHIQTSPKFFGESQRERWEEVYNTKVGIKKITQDILSTLSKVDDLSKIKLEFIEEKDKDNQVRYDKGGNKILDSLARFHHRFGENGYEGWQDIKLILELIANELGVDLSNYGNGSGRGNGRFYLSGRERQKYKLIKFEKSITAKKILEICNFETLFNKAILDLDNENKNHKLRDTIQLSKTISSFSLLNSGKKEQIEINYLHSKLSGYNAFASKNVFVARYSIQASNGGQCLLGLGLGVNAKKQRQERYFYAFPQITKEVSDKIKLEKIQKGNTHKAKDLCITNKGEVIALQVASSRYQIQFLDWYMGRHKKKKTSLEIGGAFSVLEKTITLNWKDEYPSIYKEEDKRLFVSQPFTLIPKNDFCSVKGRKNRILISKNRYIGVDIGEYGLAWSLIEISDKEKISLLEQGFIYDEQQLVLKENVKSWRQNQVRQIFSSPNTKITRLRESLIGSLRSKIEGLALKKNATLSFEYEVSGFEAGSNKIAKIYDSIKKGSVKRKENNIINDHNWGKKGLNSWAFETTAAGTSQFCTKCKRWPSLAISDKQHYELLEYEDGLFKTPISDGEVRLLRRVGDKVGQKIKGSELKSRIYSAMRPNIKIGEDKIGQGMQIVKREMGDVNFEKMKESFGPNKKRGNMAVFVCPYTDCHYIADADLQASFNIAIRGYLKDKNMDKSKSLTKEFLVDQERDLLNLNKSFFHPGAPSLGS